MSWFDALTEGSARAIARRTSRRSVLGSLGSMLMGASVLPLLPIARGASAAENPAPDGKSPNANDPNACEYWRHCGIDGFLCGCCGGSTSTCHNPDDGRMYVVSYNDCCGKSACGRCLCNRNEGDTPLYIPFQSNDYDWCSGSSAANIAYHCSTSRIVGVAK